MAHSDCGWTCGCAGKNCEIAWEHAPYLSASAVVIHYEEALYQVYAPLPLSVCTNTDKYTQQGQAEASWHRIRSEARLTIDTIKLNIWNIKQSRNQTSGNNSVRSILSSGVKLKKKVGSSVPSS